jgi:hypothetical protein
MSRLWGSRAGQLLTAAAAFVFIAAIVATSGAFAPGSAGPAAPGKVPAGDPNAAPDAAFTVAKAVGFGVTKPLRSNKPVITPGEQEGESADEEEGGIGARRDAPAPKAGKDPLVGQSSPAPTTVSSTAQNFEGISNLNSVYPPDTNGDVGPNHYVQWVNLSLAIYSKTGTLLWGPSNGNVIWSAMTGSVCRTYNNGDPIVLYDQLADRWMISQFALPGGANGYHQCIAVSQTGDPTGAWYTYDFLYSSTNMNDYPHFGVWPDGYYMSVNQFANGSSWAGQGVAVFERTKMLTGDPTARMVKFDLYSTDKNLGGMLPSDLDGATPPPAGAPNAFAEMDDNAWGYSPDQVQIWNFHVDWANTANSTFTKNTALTTASFDSNLCGYARSCIPQKSSTVKLDSLADRLMYRLQYRNFGGYQTLVVNHTVDTNGADLAGVRWYEIRNAGSGWSIYQQGTIGGTDTTNRWIGSAAMNGSGGIAVGYSASSASLDPSIRYTGRVAGDPLGTMPQGEGTVIAGTGAQTGSASRWGDYSMLAVDPTDDCTFWFTSEYVQTTGTVSWRTRIASFTLPGCSSTPPTTGAITGRVTDSSSGLALTGATVQLNNGSSTTSASDGSYTFFNLAEGSYDVTASKSGYVSQTASAVGVTAGSTTTRDFALAPTPTYVTGWILPGTVAAVTLSAGDNNGYETNAATIKLADNVFATDANSGTGNSQTCTATTRDKETLSGFSFGTASVASPVIKGIEVQLNAKVSSTSGSPKLCVMLSTNGGVTWFSKTTANLSKTAKVYTLGSASDLWGGTTWTWTGLSTFQVRIVDLANSTKITFSLDYVRVRITYQ